MAFFFFIGFAFIGFTCSALMVTFGLAFFFGLAFIGFTFIGFVPEFAFIADFAFGFALAALPMIVLTVFFA